MVTVFFLNQQWNEKMLPVIWTDKLICSKCTHKSGNTARMYLEANVYKTVCVVLIHTLPKPKSPKPEARAPGKVFYL